MLTVYEVILYFIIISILALIFDTEKGSGQFIIIIGGFGIPLVIGLFALMLA